MLVRSEELNITLYGIINKMTPNVDGITLNELIACYEIYMRFFNE